MKTEELIELLQKYPKSEVSFPSIIIKENGHYIVIQGFEPFLGGHDSFFKEYDSFSENNDSD